MVASDFVLVHLVCASSQFVIAFVVHRHGLSFMSSEQFVSLSPLCVFVTSAVHCFLYSLVVVSFFVCSLLLCSFWFCIVVSFVQHVSPFKISRRDSRPAVNRQPGFRRENL